MRTGASRVRVCALVLAAGLALSAGAESFVTLFGGAECVGGSSALVENGETRVLVDCGSLYSEERSDEDRRDATVQFGFDPRAVGDLLITHAHQDHAGRVPQLVRAGFAGRIWMTEPTLCVLSIVWRSQMRYDDAVRAWKWSEGRRQKRRTAHWRDDCSWAAKIDAKNLRSFTGVFDALEKHICEEVGADTPVVLCRTCQELELGDILKRVRTVEFGKPFAIGPFTVAFSPVKHLPGAAAIRFSDGEASWVFSGDLGTLRSRLTTRLEPAEKSDVVFVESTSGDHADVDAEAVEAERRRFRRIVGEAVKAGGIAWIPAFAVDRTQRVLMEIARGQEEGLVPRDVPIHYLSSSSREVTREYLAHGEWFDQGGVGEIAGLVKSSARTFDAERSVGRAAILLTTSGMMDAGASYGLLPSLAPRGDVTVCLVGYQAPNTCGGRLKAGERTLKVVSAGERKDVAVGCRVESFGCFSGHADAREVERWLANNLQSKIYLVHGDPASLEERRKGLADRLGVDVEIARRGRKYAMKPRGQRQEDAACGTR